MKKLRQSKTFWINLMLVAVGAIGGAVNTEIMSPQVVGYMVAATGVINIILRIITGKPIKGM